MFHFACLLHKKMLMFAKRCLCDSRALETGINSWMNDVGYPC